MFVSFNPGVTPENVELVKASLRTLMTPLQVRVAAAFALVIGVVVTATYVRMNRQIKQLTDLLSQEKTRLAPAPVVDQEATARIVEEAKKPLKEKIARLEKKIGELEAATPNPASTGAGTQNNSQEITKLRAESTAAKQELERVKKQLTEEQEKTKKERAALATREEQLNKRSGELTTKEGLLLDKNKELTKNTEEFNRKQQALTTNEQTYGGNLQKLQEAQGQLLLDRQELVKANETLTTDRETLVQDQEKLTEEKRALETKEQELATKETCLTQLEEQLKLQGETLAQKERALTSLQEEYTNKLSAVATREQTASQKELLLEQQAAKTTELARELTGKQKLLDEASQREQKLIDMQSQFEELKRELEEVRQLSQSQSSSGDLSDADQRVLDAGNAAQQRRQRRSSIDHIDNKTLAQLQKSSSSSKVAVPSSPMKKGTPPVPRTEMTGMLGIKKEYKEFEIGDKQLGAISWPYIKKTDPRYGMTIAQDVTFKVGQQEHQASVFGVCDLSVKGVENALTKKIVESLKISFEEHLVQDYSDEQIEQALLKAMQKVPDTFNFKKKPNQAMATIAVLLNNKIWVCTVGSTRTILYTSKQETVRLSERFESSQIKVSESDKLWVTSEATVKAYSLEDAKNGWLILTSDVFYELYSSEQIGNLVDALLKKKPSSSPKDIADHIITTVMQLLGTEKFEKHLEHADVLVVKL